MAQLCLSLIVLRTMPMTKMSILTPWARVNGFGKKRNDRSIVMAFRAVLVIAATRAPKRRVRAAMQTTPKKPHMERVSIDDATYTGVPAYRSRLKAKAL